MYPELKGLDFEQLKERFEGDPQDGPLYYRVYYDEVALGIRERGGREGIEYLLRCATGRDVRRIPSALTALTVPTDSRNPEEIASVLLGHFDHEDEQVAAAAIRGWGYFTADARHRLLEALRDPRPLVRAAVIIALGASFVPVSLVADALKDPDRLVRMAAIDVLDELGAIEFLPDVEELKSDSDDDVRQAAETFLRNRQDETDEAGPS